MSPQTPAWGRSPSLAPSAQLSRRSTQGNATSLRLSRPLLEDKHLKFYHFPCSKAIMTRTGRMFKASLLLQLSFFFLSCSRDPIALLHSFRNKLKPTDSCVCAYQLKMAKSSSEGSQLTWRLLGTWARRMVEESVSANRGMESVQSCSSPGKNY